MKHAVQHDLQYFVAGKCAQELYISAKEPYISAKEPYMSAKEPHIKHIQTKHMKMQKMTCVYLITLCIRFIRVIFMYTFHTCYSHATHENNTHKTYRERYKVYTCQRVLLQKRPIISHMYRSACQTTVFLKNIVSLIGFFCKRDL